MRFPGWMLFASLNLTGAVWCQEIRPDGVIVFPKSARLGHDPPIQYLQEFASVYQALKAGKMPPRLGPHFLTARNLLADPKACVDLRGSSPLVNLQNSFSRAFGGNELTRQYSSDRVIVIASTLRYACPDEVAVGSREGAFRVPGYEVMTQTKGTFIETIAPRKMTVLPGMTPEQAQAFQKFGDITQGRRTDPGAASAPGSIADRIAQIREINKLPPEQREHAAKELEARIKADQKGQKVAQAHADEIGKPMQQALTDSKGMQERALEFLGMLKAGEAYVDLYKYYVREGDNFGALHYLAVVSGASGSRLIRLGAAEPIDAAIAGYAGNGPDRKLFEASWKELQRLLAQPLLAALPAGTTAIWVSPDSELFNVPFASLMLEPRAELSVAVVPSAYDFVRLQTASTALPSGKALLVGDLIEASQAVPLAEISSGFDPQKLQVQKLSGAQATLPAVMTSMKDAQFILFSTHGRWANGGATTEEAFGSAGIELWADAPGAPGSVLTGADVARVELPQTDLVVLLACETAQGQATNGQGSLGFQSAFMASGARSLLVALWKVPADASKELIQHFYDGLFKHGLSRAESLKQAQMALRTQERYADPWNWGGWILLGDPKPVVH